MVLFTGGDPTATGNGTSAVDYTFAFDVNSNQWKVGPPKPTPAYGLCNFTSVVDNDSLYMVALGGFTPAGEIAANEWLNLGPFQLVVGVKENNAASLGLSCSPNPVTDVAKIDFSLVKAAHVKAVIVDVLGNEMEVLTSKNMTTGSQQLIWNSSSCANGIYLCKIWVDGNTATQKIVKY